MIDQLLTVLHYTGLFALCLPSLFFVASIICLLTSKDKKTFFDCAVFWLAVCLVEYGILKALQYLGAL